MPKKFNLFTDNHISSKRNYLKRMLDEKVKCMKVAKKYDFQYWDGDRRFGYGGFSYIKSWNEKIVKKLYKKYDLSGYKNILDLGCGKCFLLHDLFLVNNNLNLHGADISIYAKKNSKIPNKKNYKIINLNNFKKLPYTNNYFDLTISSGLLHNLYLPNLIKTLQEIDRVSKKSFIMVESYRNDRELFNLQCWALTCNSFFHVNEWTWLFKKFLPKTDYEFIFFK